ASGSESSAVGSFSSAFEYGATSSSSSGGASDAASASYRFVSSSGSGSSETATSEQYTYHESITSSSAGEEMALAEGLRQMTAGGPGVGEPDQALVRHTVAEPSEDGREHTAGQEALTSEIVATLSDDDTQSQQHAALFRVFNTIKEDGVVPVVDGSRLLKQQQTKR
ncbi:unnamed protein product, partial [Amoebophrya sp. A25]